MMMKTGKEVAQDYTILDYIHPVPQKDIKSQDITIVAGPGVNLAPKFVLLGNSKEKVGKETPPDELIMDNLEILLVTTVDKYNGNAGGAIV